MKNTNYLKIDQNLAEVNKKDEILGVVDKWTGHKNATLHRGFTVILKYNGGFYLQHRKHLVFDNTFDLTFSSHQLYIDGKLESDKDSIIRNLKREFIFEENDLELRFLGKIYYKEKDKKSQFTEHEIDYIYEAELTKPLNPNYEFAYGTMLVSKDMIMDKGGFIYKNLAPWAKKLILKLIF